METVANNASLFAVLGLVSLFVIGSVLDGLHILGTFVSFWTGFLIFIGVEASLIQSIINKLDEKIQTRFNNAQQENTNYLLSSDNVSKMESRKETQTGKMSGDLFIQLNRKKIKSPCYCLLDNKKLYISRKKDSKKLELLQQIPLDGAEIRKMYEGEKDMKYAIEVIHNNKKFMNVENLVLLPNSEHDSDRWYYALLTVCIPYNGFVDFESNQKIHKTFDKFWNMEEKAHWMNAILSRIHLNMRTSEKIQNKITQSLTNRLELKIKEKRLDSFIRFLKITKVDIGNKPPFILRASLLPPDKLTGDLMIDLDIAYTDGDAMLHVIFCVEIHAFGRKWVTIPIHVNVVVASLSGKIQLRCPPFPAERFSFFFVEMPNLDLNIDIQIGQSTFQLLKRMVLPRIEKLIADQLKVVIVEKIVAPHRKYIRIPTTNENKEES